MVPLLDLLVLTLLVATAHALTIPPSVPRDTPFRRVTSTLQSLSSSQAPVRPHPATRHTFHWHFPLRNVEWLLQQHASVSDSTSDEYREFLSRETIDAMIAPDYDSTVRPVVQWLTSGGIDPSGIQYEGHRLVVTSGVASIEAMLNVTLHYHSHTSHAAVKILRSTDAVTVPSHLDPSVHFLRGVNDLPPRLVHHSTITDTDVGNDSDSGSDDVSGRHRFSTQSVDSQLQCGISAGAAIMITPYYIAKQYSFPVNPVHAGTQCNNVKLAIIGGALVNDGPNEEFVREFYSPDDLAHYIYNLNYDHSNGTSYYYGINSSWAETNDQAINQSPNNGLPASEATLDIESVYAFCPQCQIGLFPMRASDSSFYNVYHAISNLDDSDRPHIVAMSYSYGSDYDAPDRDATDLLFVKLGLLGVTVIAASGDDGAVSTVNNECDRSYRQHNPTQSNVAGPMVPNYPASSPYLLSVGGTDFVGGLTPNNVVSGGYFGINDYSNNRICGTCPSPSTGAYYCQRRALRPEQAVGIVPSVSGGYASSFSSGGGFSQYARRPMWQNFHVSQYLRSHCNSTNNCQLPPSSYYNANNRAFPDVSFYGGLFGIGYYGKVMSVVGTSLSSPGFGAVIAMLVNQSLSLTNKSLGFVNPLLYQMSLMSNSDAGIMPFADIVSGDNFCPRIYGGGSITAANCHSQCSGYYAAPGWDPVSGIGTPNVTAMMSLLPALLTGGEFQWPNVSEDVSSTGGAIPPLSSSASSTSPYHVSGASSLHLLVPSLAVAMTVAAAMVGVFAR